MSTLARFGDGTVSALTNGSRNLADPGTMVHTRPPRGPGEGPIIREKSLIHLRIGGEPAIVQPGSPARVSLGGSSAILAGRPLLPRPAETLVRPPEQLLVWKQTSTSVMPCRLRGPGGTSIRDRCTDGTHGSSSRRPSVASAIASRIATCSPRRCDMRRPRTIGSSPTSDSSSSGMRSSASSCAASLYDCFLDLLEGELTKIKSNVGSHAWRSPRSWPSDCSSSARG